MSDDMCIYKLIKYAVSNGVISPNNARLIFKGLITRDLAIKRIKDIINHESVGHILYSGFAGDHLLSDPLRGAVNELMTIFDIKNEEIMEDSSKTLSIEPIKGPIYLKLGGETIGQIKPGNISDKPIDITRPLCISNWAEVGERPNELQAPIRQEVKGLKAEIGGTDEQERV